MKDFFKIVFGSAIGFVIASILFSLLTILLFVGMAGSLSASFSRDAFTLQDNSVLHLRLSGTIEERVPENDPFTALLGNNRPAPMGLNDIVSAIRKAKTNDKIRGIFLDSRAFSASMATLSEIRQELIRFQESGKFIIAYADTYQQGGYYLASVADKIVINPQGALILRGLSASPMFFADALDNLGIEMQIIRVGDYKSATEPFTQMQMSAENREQMTSVLNDMWSFIRNAIAEGRSLTPERIDELADKMTMFQTTEFLLAEGLVDAIKYETEMRNYLRDRLNIDRDESIPMATVANMRSVTPTRRPARQANNTIALLYATGNITSGTGAQGIQDRFMVNQIERLRRNDDVKAVVLRINSGGGSAFASEQIWRALSDLAAEKPLVVSMGDVAASGAYYISAAAHKIVAQPNTITGSIGVFSMIPNLESTARRIGVATDIVKTNEFSDFGDITRPLNVGERELFQVMTYRVHNLFLTRSAEGRGMTVEDVDKIAGGRIWSGNQAKQHGLVDELGGITRAIEIAAELADLEEGTFRVNEFPRMRSPLEELFNRDRESIAISALREYLGGNFDLMMMLRDVKNEDFIQARMPFDLNIR
jgi:protease-4